VEVREETKALTRQRHSRVGQRRPTHLTGWLTATNCEKECRRGSVPIRNPVTPSSCAFRLAVELRSGAKSLSQVGDDSGCPSESSIQKLEDAWSYGWKAENNPAKNLRWVQGQISFRHFVPGQYVDVAGITKEKSFKAAMKIWGFKGGSATHRASLSHRSPDSIGQRDAHGKRTCKESNVGRRPRTGDIRQTTEMNNDPSPLTLQNRRHGTINMISQQLHSRLTF
ncbi:hypothetical protein M8C21_008509, partial [Ambrosia artemisiifolia]